MGKKRLLQFILLMTLPMLLSCSKSDAIRLARAAATGNVGTAATSFARSKAMGYAMNPKALARDLKNFKALIDRLTGNVSPKWGKKDIKITSRKVYVKYTQNYKSRARVDFDKGIITVETVDRKSPRNSLRNAIVTTLLTPDDPRAVDLYSDKRIKLTGTPFLLGEVLDERGRRIDSPQRAERFAEIILQEKLLTKRNASGKTVNYVTIPMVRDHLMIRARKFRPMVNKAAQRFGLSRNFIYAIIKVESDFNPFAISHAMAVGLMQVVPSSAGGDVYRYLHGRKGYPTREILLDPWTNITYGSAYLYLLRKKLLTGIHDPLSMEYCVIAGYNTGPGNVLRTFSRNRSKARAMINSMPPAEVYKTLVRHLPYNETRRYLVKVLKAKKQFVKL